MPAERFTRGISVKVHCVLSGERTCSRTSGPYAPAGRQDPFTRSSLFGEIRHTLTCLFFDSCTRILLELCSRRLPLCVHVCLYVHVHMCMCACVLVCLCACVHVRLCAYAYVWLCSCLHVRMCACVRQLMFLPLAMFMQPLFQAQLLFSYHF